MIVNFKTGVYQLYTISNYLSMFSIINSKELQQIGDVGKTRLYYSYPDLLIFLKSIIYKMGRYIIKDFDSKRIGHLIFLFIWAQISIQKTNSFITYRKIIQTINFSLLIFLISWC